MAVTVDSLELKITHDSADAKHGIDLLVRALRRLKEAAGMGADLKEVADGIRMIKKITEKKTGKGGMAKAMQDVKSAALDAKKAVEETNGALTMKEISANAHKGLGKIADHWDDIVKKSRRGVAVWESMQNVAKAAERGFVESMSRPMDNYDKGWELYNGGGISGVAQDAGYWDDWKAHMDSYKTAAQKAAEIKAHNREIARQEKAAQAEADRRHKVEDQIVKDYEKQQAEAEKLKQKQDALAQKEREREEKARAKAAVDAQKASIKQQAQDIKNANAEYSRIVGMFSKFGGIAMRLGGRVLSAVTEPFKKIHEGYKRLVGMVKRMILRRLIMAALRTITDGFKTGLENLYQYSYAINGIDASHAYQNLDKLASIALYVKNSVGAAAMPIINLFIPVLQKLASWAVMAANAINQLVSAFSGGTTYTKAKEAAVDYMDGVKNSASGANKAAKELKATLLGFDEINRLDDQDKASGSGGGGGGSAKIDYKDYFEPAQIDSAIKDLADQIKQKIKEGDWEGIGKLLGNKLNEAVSKIDAKAIGKKITTAISNGAKLVAGFLKSTDFKQIGTKIGDFIDGAIEGIDAKAFADAISGVFTGTIDVMLGWIKSAATNGTGSKVATRLYIFLKTALANVKDYLKSTEWDKVGVQLFKILDDFVKNFDYSDIANDFWNTLGHVCVASYSLQAGFIAPAVKKWLGSFRDSLDSKNGDALSLYRQIAWKVQSGILDVFGPTLIIRGAARFFSDVVKPFLEGIAEALGGEGGKKKFNEIAEKVLSGIFAAIVYERTMSLYLLADLGIGILQALFPERIDDNKRDAMAKTVLKAIKTVFKTAVSLLLGDTYIGNLAGQVIDKFFNPIIGKTNELHSGLSRVIGDMKQVGNSQLTIKKTNQGSISGNYVTGYYTQMRAEGGYVNSGDLFFANENGAPELVGTIGGRTAVASNQEITGITNAVYGTGAAEAALLKEQNALLRQLIAQSGNVTITADSIVSGLARKNRRDGVSTVPVSI